MRRRVLLLSAAIMCFFVIHAYDLPNDMPTFEALMALHKCVKADEDAALKRVAASFGAQSYVTKGAQKFNDVRTT